MAYANDPRVQVQKWRFGTKVAFAWQMVRKGYMTPKVAIRTFFA